MIELEDEILINQDWQIKLLNKIKMLEMYCQNTVIIIKMVGKIYHKEPQGSLKGCINKQNT